MPTRQVLYVALGALVLGFLIANGLSPDDLTPERPIVASEDTEIIRTEVNPDGTSAVPVWFQDGVRILDIWVYPTERDLAWYVPEERDFYVIPEPERMELIAQLDPEFPYAQYVFYSVPIFLIAFPLLSVAVVLWHAARKDSEQWRTAATEDTYVAYQTYLDEHGWWKRHAVLARRRMEFRVSANVAFYLGITGGETSDLGRSLAQQVARMYRGEAVEIGLEFKSINRVGDVVSEIRERSRKVKAILARIDQDDPRREQAEHLDQIFDNQLQHDIHSPANYFDGADDSLRAKILAQVLGRSLSSVFPEPIVKVTESSTSEARISVTCEITEKEGSFYASDKPKQGQAWRPMYPGVKMDWDISFLLGSQRLAHQQFRSEPDPRFRSNLGGEAVYRMMAATAFIGLGRRLMQDLGLKSDASTEVAAGSVEAVGDLFRDFLSLHEMYGGGFDFDYDELADFFRERAKEVAAVLAGVAATYEQDLSTVATALAASAEAAASAVAGLAGLTFEG